MAREKNMGDLRETTAILADLVAFPTVSADSNLEMIAYLASRLDAAGARVEVMQDATGTKANLFATLGPDGDGGIVLSGHSDVVPVADQDWSSDPFGMVARDDCLFGRGTCDMKGFIAAAVAMAPLLADTKRPIHFAFTYDEEVGCFGGQALVAALRERGIRPAMAIIGEPTEMRIIEGHRVAMNTRPTSPGTKGMGRHLTGGSMRWSTPPAMSPGCLPSRIGCAPLHHPTAALIRHGPR
jgi:acetylornithine deacetylase